MTADERINALLERAGSPLMFVANPELHTVQKEPIYDTLEDCIEAIVKDRTRGLCDTIDRLEIALHNVLNERDAAISDLSKCSVWAEPNVSRCSFCSNLKEDGENCKVPVYLRGSGMVCERFEWRGVPDKEGEA